jgi:hypothetical protein
MRKQNDGLLVSTSGHELLFLIDAKQATQK